MNVTHDTWLDIVFQSCAHFQKLTKMVVLTYFRSELHSKVLVAAFKADRLLTTDSIGGSFPAGVPERPSSTATDELFAFWSV